MAERAIPSRTLIVIGLVFLALVAVHLLWSGDAARDQAGEPVLDGIRIVEKDGVVEIEPPTAATADDLAILMQGRIRRLLHGAEAERRAAAVEMAGLINGPAGRDMLAQLGPDMRSDLRRALLGHQAPDKGLNDPDPVVSAGCRDALIGIWRTSGSSVRDGYLRQGLTALEAGQVDTALQVFRKVERLGGTAPPDLYRLLAEAYLAKAQPDDALAACHKALLADAQHFPALYAMARAYAQMGKVDQADKALAVALAVYRDFSEAKELQAAIRPTPAPDAAP
ncbi:MAG: tetratricopeptide repeat protein [Candidatus Brocadiaceae bacterium]|nr:tetratricopeptide repeat protein [Candidatus Brocadiaceae bacterium]